MPLPAASPFFDKTYKETMSLLVEARNYVAFVEWRERQKLPIPGQLILSCESLRITSRLTQVMAWLLLQRAVQNGELSLEEACGDEHRLGGDRVCLESNPAADKALPDGIRSLLDRSRSLYCRVRRLEEMINQKVCA
ncbi:MAG: DUF1465 family protein [Alphaproteobacteria bacterium]|nr:DUF1465 family protein [Alphaproteobacteria bacterium]